MALIGLVAVSGLAGCDDPFAEHPDSIAGTWSCVFTRDGNTLLHETWFFAQNGSSVSGSYTFKEESYTFTGTYNNGKFRGTDSDN